jgi:RNA polymerase sigma-70 factor (ECF subfamily)
MAIQVPFEYLMTCLRRGDPQAACEVFDRYAGRLVALAAEHLPRALQAKLGPEDVVQSVFRSFFRRQAAGAYQLEGWEQLWRLLAAITVHKCGHQVEKFLTARRDVRRELPGPLPDSSSDCVTPPIDPAPTPAEALLLAETLREVLDSLTERERHVAVLRLQGLPVAQIAAELRCAERTVARHLDAVRSRLKAQVAAD